jgi:hypothetical protein
MGSEENFTMNHSSTQTRQALGFNDHPRKDRQNIRFPVVEPQRPRKE